MASSKPKNNNCSVCLPVEIGVTVNVRTLGPPRPRGGNEHERLEAGETTEPVSALQDIVRKQRAILEGLALAQSPHERRKSKAKIDSVTNESSTYHQPQDTRMSANHAESGMYRMESTKKLRHGDYRKKADRHEVMKSSFETADNENVENEYKSRKRRLKGGKNEYDEIEGESNMYQFQIKGNRMVELYDRKKVRVSKLDATKSNTSEAVLNRKKIVAKINNDAENSGDSS